MNRGIVVSGLLLIVGACGAGVPANADLVEAAEMHSAVWAPKRMYAPLSDLTRAGAEKLLRAEANKECGSWFESRTYTVRASDERGAMLALEYVCVGSAGLQSSSAVPELSSFQPIARP